MKVISSEDPRFGKSIVRPKKYVGGYVLGRSLGEGAFAVVRLGEHLISGEKVAVKVIRKRSTRHRKGARENACREAALLQMLSHPNIVELYEVLETDSTLYLVTELADGTDFIKYICERVSLSEEESRKFFRQIVSAVEYMHRCGVIHRDLKIENLLLDKWKRIKIIDFGLSNHWQAHHPLTTQCGSPAYTAPEIFNRSSYGPAVDIWSIGVNLHVMLTGKLPFLANPPNSLNKLLNLILKGCNPPSYLSEECQDLLHRLLEPNPAKRISLREVMLHPWVNRGQHQLSPWPLRVPEQMDPRVVRFVTHHLGVGETSLADAVRNRKPSAMVATYRLIQRRLQRGLGLPSSALQEEQGEEADQQSSTQDQEEDSICPLYMTEQGSPRTEKLDGFLAQRDYKACLKQLHQRKQTERSAEAKRTLSHCEKRVSSSKSADCQTDSATAVKKDENSFVEYEMQLPASTTPQAPRSHQPGPTPVPRVPQGAVVQQRKRVLMHRQRWGNGNYLSTPAPPNSALGNRPPLPIMHRSLTQVPHQDRSAGDSGRTMAWDLQPLRLRTESPLQVNSRAVHSTKRRPTAPSTPRSGGRISKGSSKQDSVQLTSLGLVYWMPDHSRTLMATRPRRQPLTPAATPVHGAPKTFHSPLPQALRL